MRIWAISLLACAGLFCGAIAEADSPSPSPLSDNQAITFQFPPLVDSEVPDSVLNGSDLVSTDMPKPYKDRCHVQQNLTSTKASCVYGNLTSKITIVLFGDSHALSWFPAIEKLAIAKKWRLLSLTMSSCWPAAIPAWNSSTHILMSNCSIWRSSALKRIAQIKPYITFVTGTRGFSTIDGSGQVLTGDARTQSWQKGMSTSLNKIKVASLHTVLISDNPVSTNIFPECLEGSPTSVKACSTPVSAAIDTRWLGIERDLAAQLNISWIDPTTWICNTDPCSPLANEKLIYRDGGHMTASFAVTLERPLWAQLSTMLSN